MTCRFFYVYIFWFLILGSVTASQLKVGWAGLEEKQITIYSQFVTNFDPANQYYVSGQGWKLEFFTARVQKKQLIQNPFRWSPPVPASACLTLGSTPRSSAPSGAGGRSHGVKQGQTSPSRLSGVDGRNRDPYPPYPSQL